MKNKTKIEALFLMSPTATVEEIYQAIYERPAPWDSKRRISQAIGPELARYHKATGNKVRSTEQPYTYTLVYAA